MYIAYCLPYTFSCLHRQLKSLVSVEGSKLFMREHHLCYSLSGVSVPLLTITSHVEKAIEAGGLSGHPVEINKDDFSPDEALPVHSHKKYIVLCARVHPGESNSSYIMHGFLDFITSQDPKAIDLRRKIVFKIVPMINPDGVIAGNYRTSLSGNDLNR